MAKDLKKHAAESIVPLHDSIMKTGTEEQKRQATAVLAYFQAEQNAANEAGDSAAIKPGDLSPIEVDAEGVRDELQSRVKVKEPKRLGSTED